MSDTPPTGPSPETIRNLNAMMPSFIKGLRERKVIGKGNAGMILRPQKCCKVCAKLWDRKFVKASDDTMINPENCGECDARLKAGQIAFVCGDKYAFVEDTGGKLEDMRGSMVHVSPHVMEQIEPASGGAVQQQEQPTQDDQQPPQAGDNPTP